MRELCKNALSASLAALPLPLLAAGSNGGPLGHAGCLEFVCRVRYGDIHELSGSGISVRLAYNPASREKASVLSIQHSCKLHFPYVPNGFSPPPAYITKASFVITAVQNTLR